MLEAVSHKTDIVCFHCGDFCPDKSISKEDKYFCCKGCLFVHELLRDNKLDSFYELTAKSGIKPREIINGEFDYLDDPQIKDKLLQFSAGGKCKITFYIPEIYCSACVWLLEKLGRLDKGLLETRVNFLRKELSVLYDETATSLKNIVQLLTMLGYKPSLNLADAELPKNRPVDKSLIIKLGIAGFCFGNIMLLAFPEYLAAVKLDLEFSRFIGILNFLLSLPLIYSAWGYFKSAWNGFKLRQINIDIPLSIGILALFIRSYVEIASGVGAGYTDSLAGLIFFLLIGKVFRQKTYNRISFARDYRYYFPLSVIKLNGESEEFIPLKQLQKGDSLLIRNNEIIPCDSVLISGVCLIDYSFVTGESNLVEITKGGKIYAGGRVSGISVKAEAISQFNQSYLTGLWNNDAFLKDNNDNISKLSNIAAKYFTIATIAISAISFLIWAPYSLYTAINVFTAVLIVACPCALALSIPFAMGTILRIFSRYGFFLKNDKVIERLAEAKAIVFDKTGTLTSSKPAGVYYEGEPLTIEEMALVKSACNNSTHPLSVQIKNHLSEYRTLKLDSYKEEAGNGIEALIDGINIRIGSRKWINSYSMQPLKDDGFSHDSYLNVAQESAVHVSIDGNQKGFFDIKRKYRKDISSLFKSILNQYKIVILSGDNDTDKNYLQKLTDGRAELFFNQMPEQKLEFVKSLQINKNYSVIMVGDGLNDAGALRASDAGIALVEESSNFSPGSDAILLAANIGKLPLFLDMSKSGVNIVKSAYAISILYNIIGLAFAVSGKLEPLIAAILMPLSSISVSIFAVGSAFLISRLKGFNKDELTEAGQI